MKSKSMRKKQCRLKNTMKKMQPKLEPESYEKNIAYIEIQQHEEKHSPYQNIKLQEKCSAYQSPTISKKVQPRLKSKATR